MLAGGPSPTSVGSALSSEELWAALALSAHSPPQRWAQSAGLLDLAIHEQQQSKEQGLNSTICWKTVLWECGPTLLHSACPLPPHGVLVVFILIILSIQNRAPFVASLRLDSGKETAAWPRVPSWQQGHLFCFYLFRVVHFLVPFGSGLINSSSLSDIECLSYCVIGFKADRIRR